MLYKGRWDSQGKIFALKKGTGLYGLRENFIGVWDKINFSKKTLEILLKDIYLDTYCRHTVIIVHKLFLLEISRSCVENLKLPPFFSQPFEIDFAES